MSGETAEHALVDAIDQWMRAPTSEMEYAHGYAQGIARAISLVRSTTFSKEWEAGLDAYQNRITIGADHPFALRKQDSRGRARCLNCGAVYRPGRKCRKCGWELT